MGVGRIPDKMSGVRVMMNEQRVAKFRFTKSGWTRQRIFPARLFVSWIIATVSLQLILAPFGVFPMTATNAWTKLILLQLVVQGLAVSIACIYSRRRAKLPVLVQVADGVMLFATCWWKKFLAAQAFAVAGTEAAAFSIKKPGRNRIILQPQLHIRPDESSAQVRAAAIAAFQEIVRPCVMQGKDGAIEIKLNDGAADPQFCLVTLVRNMYGIVGADAVITRCKNAQMACDRLRTMQALTIDYFKCAVCGANGTVHVSGVAEDGNIDSNATIHYCERHAPNLKPPLT
jgi:hypothetical protein